jgi:sirohydrochlorin ferrochelatase
MTDNANALDAQNPNADNPVVTADDKPAKATPWYEKEIKDLRSEAANRRVENKQLKEAVAALENKAEQADKIPDLLKRVTEMDAALKAQQEETARAKREAVLTKVVAAHNLPGEIAKLLETVPEAELEATAAVLAKHTAPKSPFGYNVSAGNSANANEPSMAKRIFDRINNNGVNVYDPNTHINKGGGVFTE